MKVHSLVKVNLVAKSTSTFLMLLEMNADNLLGATGVSVESQPEMMNV